GLEGGPGLEGAGQHQRGLLADVAHAQAVDEAVQGDGAAGVNAGHEVLHAGLAVALLGAQGRELFLVAGETENVGGLLDPAALVEGDQLLFTKAFNVERPTADEMLEVLDALERAGELAGAAAHDRL